MTKICFEATYNLSTLHKMKTAELRDIWMNVCSPPTLKEQLIREILFFQKKNRSDELKLQNIKKTDSSSRSDERAAKLGVSFERRSFPHPDYVMKLRDAPKKKSATRRRSAFKIQKMMKLSGRRSRISESRNRVPPRPFPSVGSSNLQQRNKNNAEILDVDILLDGLDSIADFEKQRAVKRTSSSDFNGTSSSVFNRTSSSVFNIKAPSPKVLIDNFENIAV